MPHLSLLHSPNLSAVVTVLLPELSAALEAGGINRPSLKCYGIPLSGACVAGQAGADMVHVSLRVLKKPERTQDVLEAWLASLAEIAQARLPADCTFTAEVSFLPKVYLSKTA